MKDRDFLLRLDWRALRLAERARENYVTIDA